MKRLEILAPAGNFASLRAAIQGGADSVFLGVGELNMRASSNINFTVETLPEAVAICHAAGVKLYLTVNTIVYNEELAAVRETLELARRTGVDAIIACDQAVIAMAYDLGLRIHLSTQLSISNTEALKFYSHWADVAVLARELTLDQVRKITDDIREQHICGPSGERDVWSRRALYGSLRQVLFKSARSATFREQGCVCANLPAELRVTR